MCKIQKYIYDVSIFDNRQGLPKVFTHTKQQVAPDKLIILRDKKTAFSKVAFLFQPETCFVGTQNNRLNVVVTLCSQKTYFAWCIEYSCSFYFSMYICSFNTVCKQGKNIQE